MHFNPVITASFPEQGNYSMERSNSGVLSKHLHSARQSTPDPRITEEVFPCSEFWDELRGSAAKIIQDLFITNKQLSEIDGCTSC